MDILTLSNLSKAFGKRQIVKDINFSVPEHSIFGFIGQNGAGKTTTMKMILGLLKMDSGEIRVCDKKVSFGQNETNSFIGYLPDVPEFYDFMTPKEYLLLCGSITGMTDEEAGKRADELLEMVGLADADKRIKGFSRGMKQRLGIAQALLNRPKLLICDEPTSALDPLGRKEILDILVEAKKETTIVFSTHILSDVERICDRIAFLHKGEIVMQGDLETIKAKRGGTDLEIEFYKAEDLVRFKEYYGVDCSKHIEGHADKGFASESYVDKDSINNRCMNKSLEADKEKNSGKAIKLLLEKQTDEDMINIMNCLAKNGICPQRIERLEPNLEDLFMEVVGK